MIVSHPISPIPSTSFFLRDSHFTCTFSKVEIEPKFSKVEIQDDGRWAMVWNYLGSYRWCDSAPKSPNPAYLRSPALTASNLPRLAKFILQRMWMDCQMRKGEKREKTKIFFKDCFFLRIKLIEVRLRSPIIVILSPFLLSFFLRLWNQGACF